MSKTINLTPEHLRCPVGECPSVTELEDGALLIVGRRGDQEAYNRGIGVSPDEQAIVIDRSLLGDLFQTQLVDTRCGHQDSEQSSGIPPEDIEEIIQWLSQGTFPGDGQDDPLAGCLLIEEADLRKILTKAYSYRWRGALVTEPISQGEFEPEILQQISDTKQHVIDGLITLKEGRRKIHTLKALLEAQGRESPAPSESAKTAEITPTKLP